MTKPWYAAFVFFAYVASVVSVVFWTLVLVRFLDDQEPKMVYDDGYIRVSERNQGQCIVSEVSYGVLR